MLNRSVIVGRLTQDPSLRYTPNGVAVSNFTIAVNRPFAKEGQQDADFINCVAWRRPAENLAQFMKKGSQVGVDGRLQTRSFENKEGQRVFVTEVVADSVQFLETKKSQGSNQGAENQSSQNQQYQAPPDDNEPIDISDSDLPF